MWAPPQSHLQKGNLFLLLHRLPLKTVRSSLAHPHGHTALTVSQVWASLRGQASFPESPPPQPLPGSCPEGACALRMPPDRRRGAPFSFKIPSSGLG